MEFYLNSDSRCLPSELSDDFSLTSSSTPLAETSVPVKSEIGSYSSGRTSPGHDLGYHTLLTRQSLTPTPKSSNRSFEGEHGAPPSPWRDTSSYSDHMSSPSSALRTSSTLSDTEKLLATFKGKKLPRCSHFDRLTDELILKVFSYLSSNHLCVCARVCRRWYFLAWEPQLWTSITLTSEKINVNAGLKTLFRLLCRDSPSVCLTVERMCLNGCARLTDKGVWTIAKRCPELRSIEIRGCSNVTNTGVTDLVSRCLNLERLDLTGCCHVTSVEPRQTTVPVPEPAGSKPDSLPVCVRQLYLQYVDLTDCQALEDSGLKAFVRNCPQLTHLFLRRCVQLTDVAVKYIASYCVMLRELSVSDCLQVTDFGLYELAKLGPNLRYLSVAKCHQVSDAGVKQIARHCYKLRYLNVRGCEAVSDDSMEVLSRSCPRLRALDIGKCDVTDYGLKLLSEHCPNLKKLSLKSCDMVTDKGVRAIAYYCRGLQQLNIQDCAITVEGYRMVKRCCKRCIIEHTNPGFY
ncbi:F-box/LRR-repeat protein 7-like [Limulus polyphemus]|uniref:F-box/LRR-repeat protein 7-like n=1 Tax=Limulus polyphemus TaxID=6850 RepID=A0ABM1BWZ6_LIMPO|nr:F-box/LRR-repeat protein 7-like [Limulus polyphemus]